MKKILSLLIVCVLIGCGEKRLLISELTNKGTKESPIYYFEGSRFSGVVYGVNSEEVLIIEGTVKDGSLITYEDLLSINSKNTFEKVMIENNYGLVNEIDSKNNSTFFYERENEFKYSEFYISQSLSDGEPFYSYKLSFNHGGVKSEKFYYNIVSDEIKNRCDFFDVIEKNGRVVKLYNCNELKYDGKICLVEGGHSSQIILLPKEWYNELY